MLENIKHKEENSHLIIPFRKKALQTFLGISVNLFSSGITDHYCWITFSFHLVVHLNIFPHHLVLLRYFNSCTVFQCMDIL